MKKITVGMIILLIMGFTIACSKNTNIDKEKEPSTPVIEEPKKDEGNKNNLNSAGQQEQEEDKNKDEVKEEGDQSLGSLILETIEEGQANKKTSFGNEFKSISFEVGNGAGF